MSATTPATNARTGPTLDGVAITSLTVPTDLTHSFDRGVAVATTLAETWDVPLHPVHVNTDPDSATTTSAAELDEAAQRLVALHPSITVCGTDVQADDIPAAVDAASGRESLVVMSSEDVGGTPATSVAEQVVARLGRPVVVAGPNCPAPPGAGAVLVPLDGSPTAEAALPVAEAFAASMGVDLWLVTAVSEATVRQVADLEKSGHQVSESGYLRQAADQVTADTGGTVGWEVIHSDDTVGAVLDFAADQGVAWIVAATHGATGLARAAFGSVTMAITKASPVPVVVVPTPSFTPQLAID